MTTLHNDKLVIKKQLDPPSEFIKESDFLCCNVEVVGVKYESSVAFPVVEYHAAQSLRIVLPRFVAPEPYNLVCHHSRGWIVIALVFHYIEHHLVLLPYNKESFSLMDKIQHLRVHVGSVEHIEAVFLIRNKFHYLRIMKCSVSDNYESRYVGLHIIQRVQFYATFAMMHLCPPVYGEAQGYGRRVERIYLVCEKEILYPINFATRNGHHAVCKLLENPHVAYLVGLAKIAATDTLPKAQMVECKLKWAYRGYQITQFFPITQLTEYQYQQMIPTCKTFDILVAVVFLYQPLEVVSGKRPHNLTKNIAPLVHTYTLSPYTLHFVRRRKGKHFKTSECLNYS